MASRQNTTSEENNGYTPQTIVNYAAAMKNQIIPQASTSRTSGSTQDMAFSYVDPTPITSTKPGFIQTTQQHPESRDPLSAGSRDQNIDDATSRRQAYNAAPPTYVPSRKNAIVLDDTTGVTQDQVLRCVADRIGGRNIHYCSRLSNGRICLYLTNPECVAQMTEGGGLVVASKFIPCRRYVSEAKKIVVSNCPPELDDNQLQKILQPYGRIVSAPTRLRVSTVHEDLKHIRSWRRSIYMMLPNEAPALPERILITSPDNVKHTLYLERDDVICTFCHGPGHLEEKCKKKEHVNESFPQLTSNYHGPASHRLFVHSQTPIPQQVSRPPQGSSSKPAQNDFMPSYSTQPPTTTQPSTSTQEKDPTIEETRHQEIPRTHEAASANFSRNAEQPFQVNEIEDPMDFDFNSEDEKLQLLKNKKRFLSPEENTHDQDNKYAKMNTSSNTEEEMSESGQFSESGHQSDQENPLDGHLSPSGPYQQVKSKKAMKKEEKDNAAFNYATSKVVFDDKKLSFYQFQEFIQKARGKANSKQVAAQITTNTSEIITKLEETIIHCNNHNLTRRLQRAAEALKESNV